MPIVTISREMGSFGGKIGRSIAKELGYAYADKAVIEKVFRQYGLTRLERLYEKPPTIWELFNYDSLLTVSMLNETMQALARRGDVVIVGRGGFSVLKGMSDVTNIRVTADPAVRAARVAKRSGVDGPTAASRVAADDAARARFVKLFYNTDLADPANFDLLIDTADTTVEDAVASAVAAVKAGPDRVGPTSASLEVDAVLAQAVADALR